MRKPLPVVGRLGFAGAFFRNRWAPACFSPLFALVESAISFGIQDEKADENKNRYPNDYVHEKAVQIEREIIGFPVNSTLFQLCKRLRKSCRETVEYRWKRRGKELFATWRAQPVKYPIINDLRF